jgi:hypothetical protein
MPVLEHGAGGERTDIVCLDEIYVGARFLDRNGTTISKVESNRITGDL